MYFDNNMNQLRQTKNRDELGSFERANSPCSTSGTVVLQTMWQVKNKEMIGKCLRQVEHNL